MLRTERILQFLPILIISSGYFADLLVKNVDNYGPYKIDYTRFDPCVGPKSRNLTDYTLNMTKQGEDYFVKINFTFFSLCHVDEIRIKTYVVKGNKKSLLINYHINDPCHHYALASIIERYFNSNKCWIKKGLFVLNLNVSNSSRTFYGKSFFYGEFLFWSVVTSKQGNLLCWVVNTIFSKDK